MKPIAEARIIYEKTDKDSYRSMRRNAYSSSYTCRFVEHSRHLEKCRIPASTLQLMYGDVSPYTEAAGSTGVADSDSSCPIVMVCVVLDFYAVSLMYSLSPS